MIYMEHDHLDTLFCYSFICFDYSILLGMWQYKCLRVVMGIKQKSVVIIRGRRNKIIKKNGNCNIHVDGKFAVHLEAM